MSHTTSMPHESHRFYAAGSVRLIDVRTPAEYRALHAEGAILMPLDQFDPAAVTALAPAGTITHLLCKSGARAAMAAQKLTLAGCPGVVVEGGTDAWAAAGLPVVRGKAAMGLERQVRIAAGTLVLTGVTLGFTVHPYWFGLAGFIGFGLTISGIINICPMGMLIARCPWNR
ncbi:MAG TPA: rhodanese family protein [Planctomycetota bacterium]|nr:rhodanese family protein [Planctomycetota bacterium]